MRGDARIPVIDDAFLELEHARDGEKVVHDYATVGLLRSHPLSLLRRHLAARRLKTVNEL
jgi:hypothetical protein